MNLTTAEKNYAASLEEPTQPIKSYNVRRIASVMAQIDNDYNTVHLMELHTNALAELAIRKVMLKMKRIEGLDEHKEKMLKEHTNRYVSIMEEIAGICIDKANNTDHD